MGRGSAFRYCEEAGAALQCPRIRVAWRRGSGGFAGRGFPNSGLRRRRHLSPEQYRERVAAPVEQIEAEGRAERESKGLQPLGVEAILRHAPAVYGGFVSLMYPG